MLLLIILLSPVADQGQLVPAIIFALRQQDYFHLPTRMPISGSAHCGLRSIAGGTKPTAPTLPPMPTHNIFDEPPEIVLPSPDSTPWLSRRGRRVNFSERDARNRQLGPLGEQFTLDLERRRLQDTGHDDLAVRVEWIADTCGDGVGFDVLSFDTATEAEMWIEVKTTGLGKYHPFLVTANEVRCSEAEPDRFHLFRVFDFKRSPRIFVLTGALPARCELQPSLYTAAPKG